MLTYAIGDIHGCADLFARLLARIEDHSAGARAAWLSSTTPSTAGPIAPGRWRPCATSRPASRIP